MCIVATKEYNGYFTVKNLNHGYSNSNIHNSTNDIFCSSICWIIIHIEKD